MLNKRKCKGKMHGFKLENVKKFLENDQISLMDDAVKDMKKNIEKEQDVWQRVTQQPLRLELSVSFNKCLEEDIMAKIYKISDHLHEWVMRNILQQHNNHQSGAVKIFETMQTATMVDHHYSLLQKLEATISEHHLQYKEQSKEITALILHYLLALGLFLLHVRNNPGAEKMDTIMRFGRRKKIGKLTIFKYLAGAARLDATILTAQATNNPLLKMTKNVKMSCKDLQKNMSIIAQALETKLNHMDDVDKGPAVYAALLVDLKTKCDCIYRDYKLLATTWNSASAWTKAFVSAGFVRNMNEGKNFNAKYVPAKNALLRIKGTQEEILKRCRNANLTAKIESAWLHYSKNFGTVFKNKLGKILEKSKVPETHLHFLWYKILDILYAD